MNYMRKYKNFIIALLLMVLIAVSAGVGLGRDCQVFSPRKDATNSKISATIITHDNDLHTLQVSERISSVYRVCSVKETRTKLSSRNGLLFLCMLAILSVFFRLIQEVYVFYSRLYVHERYCVIAYIQNKDGRKRIS